MTATPPADADVRAQVRREYIVAARKQAVMACVADRYGTVCATDDEADALVLRAMGLHWLGHPLAPVPNLNATALDRVAWPEAVAR